ncbi:septal ring lytic transglycosylase RlpA family protein [Citromicrobium sp. JLT1363]|uniref:septal ring lytic transglycosylase RlpA family protein n=1 Tax=Citromicrobium sp. JLT1363 TaxID=517722 RepID=UPI000225E2D6|nr:septal ring lytic transglycosylase RlpA family protein [Citromicrobium sp. JLT1363]
MGTEQNSIDHSAHHMPSRRERLHAFMRLKSQRRYLIGGIAALGVSTAAFAGAFANESNSPDVVKLGAGKASVEAEPLTAYEPRPTPSATGEPTPVTSESPMAGGEASYYGNELAGNRTASGEVFDPQKLTAAHRTLPLGSKVRVTNPRNGQSVVVRINDRGPFHGNRVIDLSTAAARTIGLIRSGTGRVNLALMLD